MQNNNECYIIDNQWIVNGLRHKLPHITGPSKNSYKKAIRNVPNCPYLITNEHRAMAIEGIGPAIGRWIAKELKYRHRYVFENPTQAIEDSKQQIANHKRIQKQNEISLKSQTKKRKTPIKKKPTPYYPMAKSSAYALLIYMFKSIKNNNINSFTKEQLIYNAQKYCNSHAIFNDMPLLIRFDYIKCINKIYYLNECGKQIAQQLYATELGLSQPLKPNISIFNNLALNHSNNSNNKNDNWKFKCKYCDKTYKSECAFNKHMNNAPEKCTIKEKPNLLAPYKNNNLQIIKESKLSNTKRINICGELYELILLIDSSEERNKTHNEQIRLENEFNKYSNNFKCKKYNLPIGDFCWILKSVNTNNKSKKEYLYPIIIERKRMDDLIQSIKDKRYFEQKWRIKYNLPKLV